MSNTVSEEVRTFAVKNAHPATWWQWTWSAGPDDTEITAFTECGGFDIEEGTVSFGPWHMTYGMQNMRPPGVEHGAGESVTVQQFYDAVWSGQLREVTEVPRFVLRGDDYATVRAVLMSFISDKRKLVTVQEVMDACEADFGVNRLLSVLYDMKADHILISNEVYLSGESELSFTKRGRAVLRTPNRR